MWLFSKLVILLYVFVSMSVAMATSDEIVNGMSNVIFEVVETNDIERLKKILLKNSSVVHVRSIDGATLLHLARSVETAELLLKYGAKVNAETSDGRTPLYWASTVEVARLLLNYGAKVNAETSNGFTPLFSNLHTALLWGSASEYGAALEVAQFLMDHGAKMNIKTAQQKTDVMSFIKSISHSRNDGLSLDNLRTVRRLVYNEFTEDVSTELVDVLNERIAEEKQKISAGGRSCSKVFRSWFRRFF